MRFFRLMIGVALAICAARVGAADLRSALVIGNSAYRLAPLKNPENDARDMAAVLETLGFEVTLATNLSQADMRRAIRDFGKQIQRGGTGLFYFAGHGMQVKGINYLIPVGTDIRAEDEIPDQSIDANLVLRKMETAGNPLNIVILDACRNNPFARSFRSAAQGLARMEGPTGTLIAYATAPGSVSFDGSGNNGVYTKYLLSNLSIPGLSLEQVFRRVRNDVMNETGGDQIPWESTSLTGDDFFFKPGDRDSDDGAAESPDLAFWKSIEDSDDPAMMRAYLEQFPDGIFAALAKIRLDEERPAPPATEGGGVDYAVIGTRDKGLALAVTEIRINHPAANLVFTPELVKGTVVQKLRVDDRFLVMPTERALRQYVPSRGPAPKRYVISGDVTAYGERLEYNASAFRKERSQVATVRLQLQLLDLSTGAILATGEGSSEKTASVTQTVIGTGVSRGTNPTLANDALEDAIQQALAEILTYLSGSTAGNDR